MVSCATILAPVLGQLVLLGAFGPTTVGASKVTSLPKGWHVLQDTNCVYSRLTNGPGVDSGDVHYLGTFSTLGACIDAAHIGEQRFDQVASYNSLAWHENLPGAYHHQCYGVVGDEWSGKQQHGVTSVRGPRAIGPPVKPKPTPPPTREFLGGSHSSARASTFRLLSSVFLLLLLLLFFFFPVLHSYDSLP
eukprot:SAG31_NODE_1373_length_8603_cov_4.155456_7_plen_191_part_00